MEPARFVNRLAELGALERWCSGLRPVPLYVYGSEGCGKTRLLKEFVERISNRFDKVVTIYLDAYRENCD